MLSARHPRVHLIDLLSIDLWVSDQNTLPPLHFIVFLWREWETTREKWHQRQVFCHSIYLIAYLSRGPRYYVDEFETMRHTILKWTTRLTILSLKINFVNEQTCKFITKSPSSTVQKLSSTTTRLCKSPSIIGSAAPLMPAYQKKRQRNETTSRL